MKYFFYNQQLQFYENIAFLVFVLVVIPLALLFAYLYDKHRFK